MTGRIIIFLSCLFSFCCSSTIAESNSAYSAELIGNIKEAPGAIARSKPRQSQLNDDTFKLKRSIKQFNSQNKIAIGNICNSLIKAVGKNKSYFMAIVAGEDLRLREIDSLGNPGRYFNSPFVPSWTEIQFLIHAGVSALTYNHKKDVFFAKLQNYRSGSKAITMYVYYGVKRLWPKKPAFFEGGRRKYVLSEN